MTTREFIKEQTINVTFNITLIISLILRYTGVLERRENKSLVIVLIIFLVFFIIAKLINKLLLKLNLLEDVLEKKRKRKYLRLINWSYIFIVVIVIFGR